MLCYQHFIFPLLIGTVCVFWPIFIAYQQVNPDSEHYSLELTLFCATLLSFVISNEWKEMFVAESKE